MALPSAFGERLEQMERTRNQRLDLLQAEKELQNQKSQILASKLWNIRSMEQRCLKIDCKIASQHLILSSLRSQLHRLDSLCSEVFPEFRALQNEVEELKELEKEKECFYASETGEMEDFRRQSESYVVNCRKELEQLRAQANELKSSFSKLQASINYSNNSEIAAAEMKKNELLSEKDTLDQYLDSSLRTRDQLRKQLQTILADEDHQRRRRCCFPEKQILNS